MEEYKSYIIGNICNVFAGGDASKYDCVKEKDAEHQFPVFANATDNNGLYGYTRKPTITQKAVTIAARGAGIGFTCFRDEPFVPIVRLISLVPLDEATLNPKYLYYYLKLHRIYGDGSAIPQLTVPDVKKNNIILPSLSTQNRVVSILNSIESKIELNNRINHNLPC